MNYEKIILDVVTPLVDNKEAVLVRKMPSEKEDDMLFLVVADSADLGKLIGKNGIIAKAIREVVGIAAKIDNKKLFVKFEAYNEE